MNETYITNYYLGHGSKETEELFDKASDKIEDLMEVNEELNAEVTALASKKVSSGCAYQAEIEELKATIEEMEASDRKAYAKYTSGVFSESFRANVAEDKVQCLEDEVKVLKHRVAVRDTAGVDLALELINLKNDQTNQGCDYEAQLKALRVELSDLRQAMRAETQRGDKASLKAFTSGNVAFELLKEVSDLKDSNKALHIDLEAALAEVVNLTDRVQGRGAYSTGRCSC
jgi:hypothetical protein